LILFGSSFSFKKLGISEEAGAEEAEEEEGEGEEGEGEGEGERGD